MNWRGFQSIIISSFDDWGWNGVAAAVAAGEVAECVSMQMHVNGAEAAAYNTYNI